MKKSLIKVLCILACMFLVGLIIYHMPQHRKVSMSVCNAAGETAQVEIDIKYYRRLFSTSGVEGTVNFDGDVYQDSRSLWGPAREGVDRSYWDWDWYFKDPNKVLPANLSFNKDNNDRIKAFYDRITFFNIGHEFDFSHIIFTYSNHETMDIVKYYGPAETAEEAFQVAEELGWDFDWILGE